MEQYISKTTLLAEIESLLDKGKYYEEYDCAYRDGNNGALYALKNKIDSLEVKEFDFEDTKSVFDGQYLSKDKVVTTIERLQDECEEQGNNNGVELLEKLFNKLDTLEVKEVNLEDSIKETLAQKYIDYTFKRHNIDPESREGQLIYYAYMHGMNQCLNQLKAQKGE